MIISAGIKNRTTFRYFSLLILLYAKKVNAKAEFKNLTKLAFVWFVSASETSKFDGEAKHLMKVLSFEPHI